ncbi:MAG: hypothetical protein U5K37_12770 [Natrialbaceae archaeon]|nr:hypothetical protein [Natrialbaceae archaeon]
MQGSGRSLFGGEARSLAFTVEAFSPVSVPRELVNGLFDYNESWVPSSLFRVADNRVQNNPEAIKLAVEEYDERH